MISTDISQQANGINNPSGQNVAGQSTNITDYSFYKKMWEIDPEMAKTWINARIEKLTAVVQSTGAEIRSLQKLMHLPENEKIRAYCKRMDSVQESKGMTGRILNIFRDNNHTELTAKYIMSYLEKQGVNILKEQKTIYCALNFLKRRGDIQATGRGVFILALEGK